MDQVRKLFLLLMALTLLFDIGEIVLSGILQTLRPVDDWVFGLSNLAPQGSLLVTVRFLLFWLVVELGRLVCLHSLAPLATIAGTLVLLVSLGGQLIATVPDPEDAIAEGHSLQRAERNVGDFRQDIREGSLPSESELAFTALSSAYGLESLSLKTDSRADRNIRRRLFAPAWASVLSTHPLTGTEESFVAVGINPGFAREEISRKQLNLVVVLEISASMEASLTRNLKSGQDALADRSRFGIACRALSALIDRLRPEDRLGIVLFNDQAHLAKPLRRVGETDLSAVKRHLFEIPTGGDADLEAGLRLGFDLLQPFDFEDPDEVENRVILLTDALSNPGRSAEETLLTLGRKQSRLRRHLTLLGLGGDFPSGLEKTISAIRGANSFSIGSAEEFERRLENGFERMVTPLVFDLNLFVEARGCAVERVYGPAEATATSSRMIHLDTLFLSGSARPGSAGGFILLAVRPNPGHLTTGQPSVEPATDETRSPVGLSFTVTYEERSGKRRSVRADTGFPAGEAGRGDSAAVRKAVLLARYGDLLRDWIRMARKAQTIPGDNAAPGPELNVSMTQRQVFRQFREAFERERLLLADQALKQESDLLTFLSDGPRTRPL